MKYYIPRVLCILLVMVMISSIGVGFTFSKYIVDDRADDTARISNFGVTTGVAAGAFSTAYTNELDNTVITVSSADTDKVFAPGTKGTFSGINVQGTPEVAVKVRTTADLNLGNNWVADGAYYCPLRITVNGTEYYGMSYPSASAFETAIETAITTINDEVFAPGTDLSEIEGLNGNYSWSWKFKGEDGLQTTEKDTQLGDAANATFSLVVTAKVEQVD